MNLRKYLMIKQAVLNQNEFNQMRGPNAGNVQRTWGEFLNTSPFAYMTGSQNALLGGMGNQARANRQAAADANSYTAYLKSQGLGNNALSKDEFLAQGNAPKVQRTWGEFFHNSLFNRTGNNSWKARQDKANTDAYNAYLKQNANQQNMMNQAFQNNGRQ